MLIGNQMQLFCTVGDILCRDLQQIAGYYYGKSREFSRKFGVILRYDTFRSRYRDSKRYDDEPPMLERVD